MELYSRYAVALSLVMILTWWLTRKADPLFGWPRMLLAMGTKIILGSVYGWLFLHQYGGDDTWLINTEGQVELDKLLTRPGDFFEDINLFFLVREHGWREGLHLFQDKLELALLIKPLALANLWSQGNYYINVVFFSAISFWGHFWLYRLVTLQKPGLRNWAFGVIFLYPPTLFWLSGIRGDGLLLFFFGLTLWNFSQWLSTRRMQALALWMLGLAGMAVIRSAFAALLLPALISWWLVEKQNWPVKKAFSRVYAIAAFLFFCSALLPDWVNGPARVVKKQAQFFELKGNVRVNLDTLNTHPLTFVRALPKALDNVFLRPYPGEGTGILQYGLIIQNFIIICLFLVVILRRYPGRGAIKGVPVFAGLFIFSLSVYLSIGYTIPFPGAGVRYRAIPEACLVFIAGIAGLGGTLTDNNYFNVYKKKIISNNS
nr:hypothetical protein [Flavihumibacter fluvii]